MKRALILSALALAVRPVTAQDTTTAVSEIGLYYQRATRRGIEPMYYIQGWTYITEKSGAWGFAYHEKDYASASLGLYYDFTPWFELGVAPGSEIIKGDDSWATLWRLAGMIWVGRETLFLDVYYENGQSGEEWHQINAMWRGRRAGIGIFSQTGSGTGPRALIVPLKRFPLEVWVAPRMYDHGAKRWNTLLGAQLVFQKHR